MKSHKLLKLAVGGNLTSAVAAQSGRLSTSPTVQAQENRQLLLTPTTMLGSSPIFYGWWVVLGSAIGLLVPDDGHCSSEAGLWRSRTGCRWDRCGFYPQTCFRDTRPCHHAGDARL